MRKSPRLPAAIILLAAAAGGVAVAFVKTDAPTATPRAELERRIDELGRAIVAGNADGRTWFDYAEALRGAGKYRTAADAYGRALTLDVPDIHAAQFGRALSLARDTDDAFFAYLDELVAADAKAVLSILETPEGQAKKADPRFEKIRQTAENQAVD